MISSKIHSFSALYKNRIWAIALLFLQVVSCNNVPSSEKASTNLDLIKVENYKTLVSYKEGIFTNPQIIRYGPNYNFFVYDARSKKVIELDKNGDVVNKYGGKGRGPGEFLKVNNIFLTNKYLYVSDPLQWRITRFQIDGDLAGTMNYGEDNRQSSPPPAPLPLEPRAKDINNQPSVMGNDNVLLSNVQANENIQSLYRLIRWDGDSIAEIGQVPSKSSFRFDFNNYRRSIENRQIPPYYKANVFPINDRSNHNFVYLLYNSIPKIEKYRTSGDKIWETNIPSTPEMDSLNNHYFGKTEELLNEGKGRVRLKKYVSARSGTNGHLYLALGKYYFSDPSNMLWIHEVTSKGELIRKYKVVSEEVNLPSIFDIDIKNRRLFVITGKASIRIYSF